MKLIPILLFMSLFVACTKDKSTLSIDNSNINANATVVFSGSVSQYDIYDHLSISSLDSITVKLVGSNFTTKCNVSGDFTISNIPKGFYRVEISKFGFGVTSGNIDLNSDYNGGYQISEIPSWNLTLGLAKDTTQSYAGLMTQGFSFPIFVNNLDAQSRNIQVYYNNKNGIDPFNTLTFKGKKSCWSNANESSFTLFTPYSECSAFSSSGDTVFYKVCPITYKSTSTDSSSNSIWTSVNINGPESYFIIP